MTKSPALKSTYTKLFEALQHYIATNPTNALKAFRGNISQPPGHWEEPSISPLPAMNHLESALESCARTTEPLVALFNQHRHVLKWEQSYTTSDAVVGSDMLQGYGYVEVVGKHGPFVNKSIRCGIGVWGPNIDYPVHNHEAEEIYIPLAGSAEFTLNDGTYHEHRAEESVYVPSNLRHGFRTTNEAFVVLSIWQAGDLRQKSTF